MIQPSQDLEIAFRVAAFKAGPAGRRGRPGCACLRDFPTKSVRAHRLNCPHWAALFASILPEPPEDCR